jgi:3,4-dihydroxy-9,10-secoandrosta-1,3,5(10)-triene-9,17-dione 4,5-dioxygenase
MGGIQALAYSVVQSTDLSRWQTFAEQVLGMATTLAGGLLHIKMDDRAYRILVVPGPEDRYLASGWDVADAAAFEAIIGRLQAAGVARAVCRPGACWLRAVLPRLCSSTIPRATATNSGTAAHCRTRRSHRRSAYRAS